MEVIVIGKDDLKALVQEIIEEKVVPLVNKNKDKVKEDDIIFDIKGLATYLGAPKSWIYQRTHLKEIPYLKMGKKNVRFSKKAIDRWLTEQQVFAVNKVSSRIKL